MKLFLPKNFSILTDKQLDKVYSRLPKATYNWCELSETHRLIWPEIDIMNAVQSGVWNKGYQQLRVNYSLGRHKIYYYKPAPHHKTDNQHESTGA